jgi:small subunit ribosomal protein S3e
MRVQQRNRMRSEMADEHAIVKQGVMFAEINEFFAKHLQSDGYGGMEYKPYSTPMEITLRLAKTGEVMANNKLRIKQFISLIQMRFGLPEGSLAIYVDLIKNRALCPMVQAEAIREKLAVGIPVRRAVSVAMNVIMEGGAAGVQVVVSGKLRGQRAKSYKVSTGLLVHSGKPSEDYMKKAMTSILLKQGVIGIKVAIMMQYDPTGKNGTPVPFADRIAVYSPEEIAEKREPKTQKHVQKAYPSRR